MNPDEAINLIQKEQFDIAFLDLIMPKTDGVDLLGRLRKLSPDLPVVLMSGYSVEDKWTRGKELGAVSCLRKPFEYEELFARMEAVMRRGLLGDLDDPAHGPERVVMELRKIIDEELIVIDQDWLDGKGDVKTLVGEALFEFGDVEGRGKKVRLQHALGVGVYRGKLYVADTYNSKIKLITPDLANPDNSECKTFLGDPPGWLKAKMFNEPAGLSIAGAKMYVADTNNHRIRVVYMNTKEVTTLEIQGLEPPKREKKK